MIDQESNIAPICLGDVVGYSSSPNECLEMLFERGIPILMGNHERALLRASERETFNEVARFTLDWQAKVIRPEYLERIAAFPYVIQYEKFCISHANFFNPTHFYYVTSCDRAQSSINVMPNRIGFIAHTHVPVAFRQNSDGSAGTDMEEVRGNKRFIRIKNENRYLFNVGSLGQPRDGDPRGSFVVFNSEEMTVVFHRISYDCSAEYKRIEKANLPKVLGERLFGGN